MSTDFKIKEENIEDIKKDLIPKKEFWETSLNTNEEDTDKDKVVFDDFGRAEIGVIHNYSENEFRSKITQNYSDFFEKCLFEACEELRIEPISLKDVSYLEFLSRRIKIKTKTGYEQERNLPGILAKANVLWEIKMPLYRKLKNIHKAMVKDKRDRDEINTVKMILSNMEVGNTFIAYDSLMRVFQEKKIYLSINPYDKLLSAGGPHTGSLTKFSSCWKNCMTVESDGSILFKECGDYSNPLAQVALGKHISSGMIIIPNDSKIKVGEMTLYGMAQRTHTWLSEGRIYMELLYPDKNSSERRDAIKESIAKYVTLWDDSVERNIKTPSSFNKAKWIRNYNECCDEGEFPYLDTSHINHNTGTVSIGSR